jgi:hypothetical protein
MKARVSEGMKKSLRYPLEVWEYASLCAKCQMPSVRDIGIGVGSLIATPLD